VKIMCWSRAIKALNVSGHFETMFGLINMKRHFDMDWHSNTT